MERKAIRDARVRGQGRNGGAKERGRRRRRWLIIKGKEYFLYELETRQPGQRDRRLEQERWETVIKPIRMELREIDGNKSRRGGSPMCMPRIATGNLERAAFSGFIARGAHATESNLSSNDFS